jgi:hypothetical protein
LVRVVVVVAEGLVVVAPQPEGVRVVPVVSN